MASNEVSSVGFMVIGFTHVLIYFISKTNNDHLTYLYVNSQGQDRNQIRFDGSNLINYILL